MTLKNKIEVSKVRYLLISKNAGVFIEKFRRGRWLKSSFLNHSKIVKNYLKITDSSDLRAYVKVGRL